MYFDHPASYQSPQGPSFTNSEPDQPQQYPQGSPPNPYSPNTQSFGNYLVQQPQRDLSYVNPYTSNVASNGAEPSHVANSPTERRDSTYGAWMAPVAGVAAGAIAGEAYHGNLAQQTEQPRELEQQFGAPSLDKNGLPIDDLTGGTQAQPRDQPDPTVDDFTGGTQAVPMPYVDHAASSEPTVHPATIIANQARSPTDNDVAAPTGNASSFLGEREAASVAPMGKTINGGPVPVELVETAQTQSFPSVHRTNTDISVSDLHVPGEFPKVRGTPGTAAGTFLNYD
jgi:hypothetical protein